MRVIDKSSTSSARRRGKKMTNISKELCEICGIEPKKVEKRCKECNLNMEECGCFDCYKEIYPDFEQPENFVKLLEIVSRRSSVSFCHNGSYFGCSIHYYFKDIFEADKGNIQHNFLNTLLKQDLRNPCKPKLLEQIKQSIREAEWGYDR